jgi:hypothetical protein
VTCLVALRSAQRERAFRRAGEIGRRFPRDGGVVEARSGREAGANWSPLTCPRAPIGSVPSRVGSSRVVGIRVGGSGGPRGSLAWQIGSPGAPVGLHRAGAGHEHLFGSPTTTSCGQSGRRADQPAPWPQYMGRPRLVHPKCCGPVGSRNWPLGSDLRSVRGPWSQADGEDFMPPQFWTRLPRPGGRPAWISRAGGVGRPGNPRPWVHLPPRMRPYL